MICIKCGQQLEADAHFCGKCGYPVEIAEPAPIETPAPDEIPAVIELPAIDEEIQPSPIQEEPVAVKKKRQWPAILALVLIFVFGLAVFLLLPYNDVHTDEASPWFTLQDGVLYFDETRYTGGTTLVVPETINGQPVTALSEGCFADCTDLVSIQLPETILTIDDRAFAGCTGLRGIRLPETLISLGDKAFYGCTALEAVCIPYSLSQFGDNLFTGCDKLVYFFYPAPSAYWYELPLGQIRDDASVYCADGIYPAK